ncbi:hypothetical protein [Paenisporosarcina sp. TG20]|uniref:hypothetical protein n=1 Tax=Paenisporosarcina sp. TG20 TaxID=1211706 RepID=UPI0002E07BE9|nr:hypothetical protein [Paenisporosarcina sp. TG20]
MNDHYRYNPHHQNQNPHHNLYHFKNKVLNEVEGIVQYGLKEGQYTSYTHALREVSAIAYLMGMGYEPMIARQMVESWEINETFYPQ